MFKIILIFLVLNSINCSAEETVIEVIPLNNRFGSEIESLIRPLLEDSETVIANGSNLIIKATPARQKELEKLLAKIDKPLTNLAITVMQTRNKTAKQLNASAAIDFNSSSRRRQLSSSINARGHFAQTERIDSTDSTQVISTLEGKSAYIKTGKTHPVQNVTIHHSGYNYPSVSSRTQLIEVSSGFLVTPRLTGNKVIVEVMPWSDQVDDRDNIRTQSASSTMRFKLGEWKEIGNITEQSQRSTNKILSHAYSTTKKALRILIKVEKVY